MKILWMVKEKEKVKNKLHIEINIRKRTHLKVGKMLKFFLNKINPKKCRGKIKIK